MSKLKILVVDDDRDFAEAFTELLNNEGHRTASAFSGKQALAYLKKVDFDLAFVDISMPGKDGLDVLWESQNLRSNTGFVLMTANNAAQYKDQSRVFSALGVLQKPFEPEQLIPYFDPDALSCR